MAFSLLPGIRKPGIARCSRLRTFTLGSVDLCASLFTDHCRVILFFACLIFAVGLDREIFQRSTYGTIFARCHFPIVGDWVLGSRLYQYRY